jgi:hypothetical protein
MAISEYRDAEYRDEDGLHEPYLIPPRTTQRWRASGDGPRFVRLGPRRVVYRITDIEAWLAGRTYASIADETARRRAPRDLGPLTRSRHRTAPVRWRARPRPVVSGYRRQRPDYPIRRPGATSACRRRGLLAVVPGEVIAVLIAGLQIKSPP